MAEMIETMACGVGETGKRCPRCGETTGSRGGCMCGSYSTLEVHFSLVHWGDVEAVALAYSQDSVRDLREALRREYEILPAGRICICKPSDSDRAPATSGGAARPSAKTPETVYLDLQLAYAALPMGWLGRTVAYLLMGKAGAYETEEHVEEMRRTGELAARHRRRIALETFPLTSYQCRPQDREPERVSPWQWMARFLNGPPAGSAGEEAA